MYSGFLSEEPTATHVTMQIKSHVKILHMTSFSQFDLAVECCIQSELRRPSKNLSVDEAIIVNFKGWLGMKQYMPMKPIKRGIKVWEIAEVSSGFVCNFQVYTRKRQDGAAKQNLGYRVFYNLIQHSTGKNHQVFCDNVLRVLNLQKIYCRTTFTYGGQCKQTGKISQKNLQRTMQQ